MNEEERSLFNEGETNFCLPHTHAALSFSATLRLAGYTSYLYLALLSPWPFT